MLVLSLFTLHPLLHDNKPVYKLQQQSIRRLAFVPPYSVFCSISFRCGGLSIERNQKPLTPENTLAITHHDRQKQVEVKRSSRVNPHEIRIFSGCPYYISSPSAGHGDFIVLFHNPISSWNSSYLYGRLILSRCCSHSWAPACARTLLPSLRSLYISRHVLLVFDIFRARW